MVGKLTPNDIMSCSRLPAIMGVSRWSTPNEELARTLDAMAGKDLSYTESEPAFWGNTLEPVILGEMAQRLGLDAWYAPQTMFSAKGVALNASLDGVGTMLHNVDVIITSNPEKGIYVMGADRIVLSGPGVLESKVTNGPPEDEPALYRGPIQLQGCMLCTGYRWGAIGVLYRGTELRIFVYQREQDVIDAIVEAVHEFERRKQGPDWYPPISRSDAVAAWARVDEDAPAITMEPTAVEVIRDRERALEMKKQAEEIIEAADLVLMEELGNHLEGVATDPDTGETYRIRWPMRSYKAQPEKVVPAKDAYQIRMKSIDIKKLTTRQGDEE